MDQALLEQKFPKTLVLGGESVEFRFMVREDETRLLEFFQRVPLEDRRLLKDDVLDSRTIKNWCENIDFRKVIPLLAIHEGRIVGGEEESGSGDLLRLSEARQFVLKAHLLLVLGHRFA